MFVNEVCKHVKHSKALLFTDDAKIFLPVSSITVLLQAGVGSISALCSQNNLMRNESETKCTSFTKNRGVIELSYSLLDKQVIRIPVILDLGVCVH